MRVEGDIKDWKLDIIQLLKDYQDEKARATIRSKFNTLIKKIETLQSVAGGKRGRRWNKNERQ
jgi:hypothetical protein